MFPEDCSVMWPGELVLWSLRVWVQSQSSYLFTRVSGQAGLSLHFRVLLCQTGRVVLLPRRLLCGLKESIPVKCLKPYTISIAILTPKIGHCKKKLLLRLTAEKTCDQCRKRREGSK